MSRLASRLPVIATVIAACGFSWGFIIVKSMSLPAMWIATYRLALGATFLSVLALLTRSRWPRLSLPLIAAGILFGVHQFVYIRATQLTAVAIVTVLTATKPLLVALLSRRLVDERVPRMFYVWALVAVCGVALLALPAAGTLGHDWRGDALAVLNVGLLAFCFLAIKKCRQDEAPTISLTASVQAIALVTVLPFALIAGFAAPTWFDVGLVAVIVFGPANSHLLINWALSRVSAALAMLILGLTPALACLWAYLILDEPLVVLQIIGIGLVVVAIYLAQRTQLRAERADSH